MTVGALNNEFIKKCCAEWQQKLSNGDFGNFSINSMSGGELATGGCAASSATITRSTRLKQQKLLQSLKETADSGDEDDFFYYDEEDSLPDAAEFSTFGQQQRCVIAFFFFFKSIFKYISEDFNFAH